MNIIMTGDDYTNYFYTAISFKQPITHDFISVSPDDSLKEYGFRICVKLF